MNKPSLPLDALDGVTDRQPSGDIGHNTSNDRPPNSGPFESPQWLHDTLVVQLFATRRAFWVSRGPASDGRIHMVLDDRVNRRLFGFAVKDCWFIDKQYVGRDCLIAFRIQDELYLMQHDDMVQFAEANGLSWNARGRCSRSRLSAAMRAHCAPYRIEPTLGAAWLARPTSVFI